MLETTALGAAYLAGLAVGYWKDVADVARQLEVDRVFEPAMDRGRAQRMLAGWNKAVERAKHWDVDARAISAPSGRLRSAEKGAYTPNCVQMHVSSRRALPSRAFASVPSPPPSPACACGRLRRATRALTQRYDDLMAPSGLRVTQFSLLRTIAAAGTLHAVAISPRRQLLDRTALSRNARSARRARARRRSRRAAMRARAKCR